VVYLSLEGLVTAVKEGVRETPVRSSHQLITDDSESLEDVGYSKVTGSSEIRSAGTLCDGVVKTLEKHGCDGFIDTCNSGYCVACLNGNYPIALDW